MRRRVRGRVGMIGTVKNEAPWLVEWIAHNHAIGFDAISIASNDCTDGTDKILDRMQGLGLLTHHPNPGPYKHSIQHDAYHMLQDVSDIKSCEWLISIDVDEFLVVKCGDGSVHSLLSHAEGADQLPVRCRMFGDNNLSGFVPPPVCKSFVMAEPAFERPNHVKFEDAGWYKTFVRTHRRLFVSIHYATAFRHYWKYTPLRFRANRFFCGGQVLKFKPGARQREIGRQLDMAGGNTELAQLNHYAVKTKEICELKQARSDAVRTGRDYAKDDYFTKNNFNDVKETSILKYEQQVTELMEKWLQDTQLRSLHEESFRIFQHRIDELEIVT